MLLRLLRKAWPADPDVAVDMGSARTRVFQAGRGVVADVASAAPSAVGPAARPVRRGAVVEVHAACAILAPMLRRLHRRWRRRHRVLACAAHGTAAAEAAALKAAVSEAGARDVVLVPALLAAAIGRGLDPSSEQPRAVIDIGAELTEIAVVRLGEIAAAASVPMGWADTKPAGSMDLLADRIAAEFRALLDRLPEKMQGALMPEPLVLTGGGAAVSELRDRVASRLGLAVHVPPRPELAVIRGAGAMLSVGKKTRIWG